MPKPRSYADVAQFLGKRDMTKIAHNTYLHRASDEVSYVTYHGNIIIKFHPDWVKVGHQTWPTSTTADRFQHLCPFGAAFSYSYSKGPDGKKEWQPGVTGSREDAKIRIAGEDLPDDGSSITFDWSGNLIKE